MLFRKIARQLTSFRPAVIWNASSCYQARRVHTDPGLALQYIDDVAVIRMANGKDNRINTHFLKDFHSLLDSVEGNLSCRGLVTTGEGKFYGNGLDLDWMQTITAQELLDFMHHFQEVLFKVLLFPVPTLAVINGHAYAGGAVLAFAHDIRTMNSDRGWLCFNEVFLEKRFSGFLKEFLKIKLGGGKNTSDALVLGRRYTANDAYHNHIVHAVHPGMSLFDHSLQVLQSFYGKTGIPRKGLSDVKKDIYKVPCEAYEKDSKEKRHYFAVQFMNSAQLASLEKL